MGPALAARLMFQQKHLPDYPLVPAGLAARRVLTLGILALLAGMVRFRFSQPIQPAALAARAEAHIKMAVAVAAAVPALPLVPMAVLEEMVEARARSARHQVRPRQAVAAVGLAARAEAPALARWAGLAAPAAFTFGRSHLSPGKEVFNV